MRWAVALLLSVLLVRRVPNDVVCVGTVAVGEPQPATALEDDLPALWRPRCWVRLLALHGYDTVGVSRLGSVTTTSPGTTRSRSGWALAAGLAAEHKGGPARDEDGKRRES